MKGNEVEQMKTMWDERKRCGTNENEVGRKKTKSNERK